MTYKPTFSGGMAGRHGTNYVPLSGETPRFGFYWWCWLPDIVWNEGRFSRGEVVDVNFIWLCFWCSVTFWPCGPSGERA